MKIVLLPGLDGTGVLFKPFIDALPTNVEPLVISYPTNEKLGYDELIEFVIGKLPSEDYILMGESFSGYIAYQIALRAESNLIKVIFVATFLEAPRPYLLAIKKFLPMNALLSIKIPSFIARLFLFGSKADEALITMFNQSISDVSPDVLSSRLTAISELPKAHQSCQTKAIYIQASNDKLVPKESAEVFIKLFNNMKVYNLIGDHFILQGSPKECANIVSGMVAV